MACTPASLVSDAIAINSSVPEQLRWSVITSLLCQIASQLPAANLNAGFGYQLSPSNYNAISNVALVIPGDGTSDNLAGLTAITFIGSASMGMWFWGAKDLQSVSAPNVVTIGSQQFSAPQIGISIQDCASLTSITYPVLVTVNSGIDLESLISLTTLSFPLVTTIFASGTSQNAIFFSNVSALKTISFPALKQIQFASQYGLSVQSCTALTSISMPQCTNISAETFINGNNNLVSIDWTALLTGLTPDPVSGTVTQNPKLTTITLPAWKPNATDNLDFSANALLAATVNQILARCVAQATWGTGGQFLHLNGGTNAAPTGQGINDKATLIARGASVVTN